MAIDVLNVNRIGQISGTTTDPGWRQLTDPLNRPLLTDTGRWNVVGVDEGANAEHSDGRLYFFFGDVATDQSGNPPEDSDLVAWVGEAAPLRHGGHLAMGWNFQLPITGPEIEGQPDWQFCLKCSALFWNGDPNFKGLCSRGDAHDTFGLGLNFSLPFEPTAVAGQHQWRFCANCASLFWEGDPVTTGVCPAGLTHVPAGWSFVIPVTSGALAGQQDWRFCANCHGLFFDGYPSKGICAGSPGGGIHLNAVTQDDTPGGQFDPFGSPEPIGYTGMDETPNGAFSYDNRMYVFAGFADEKYSHRRRQGDPQPGQYLFSKADPSKHGAYDVEFLLSPKLGWCARDESRSAFESHSPLGFHFLLPHDLPPAQSLRGGWRCCSQCEAVYFDGETDFKGVCQRGGPHRPDPLIPDALCLEIGIPEDVQNQSNWKFCTKCLALYWSINDSDAGLCPATGAHVSNGELFRVPHASIEPYAIGQPDWRFCDKCNSLFWNGDGNNGVCARDGGPHRAAGYNFQVPFSVEANGQPNVFWRYCLKCAALFHQHFGGVCPRDHQAHSAAGWYFSPSQIVPVSLEVQGDWHRCTKCAGLYFDGYTDKGFCPADGRGHEHSVFEWQSFKLAHNPGGDAHTRDQFRYCVRCHGMVRTDQRAWFSWTSPTLVNNQDHSALRIPSGQGVVMISYDWANFRLSWMPVTPGQHPAFDSIRYFHRAKQTWSDSPDSSPGYELFAHPFPGQYTHVSSSWLPYAQCWVALFGTASDTTNQDQPIVARFSPDLLTWSDEVPLFDPNREQAYGAYMHDPAKQDLFFPKLPPHIPGQNNKSWAYGAFLIYRYTTFNPDNRILNLVYLMSPSYPYQVQLMETAVRLPNPIVG